MEKVEVVAGLHRSQPYSYRIDRCSETESIYLRIGWLRWECEMSHKELGDLLMRRLKDDLSTMGQGKFTNGNGSSAKSGSIFYDGPFRYGLGVYGPM